MGVMQRFVGNIVAKALSITGLAKLSTEDGITAHAGGGQASAYQLTKQINRVTTVATAADSVVLPSAVAGLWVVIVNDDSADSLQVFGLGSDTINDVAAATGVAQAAGKTAVYYCTVAGKWYRDLSA